MPDAASYPEQLTVVIPAYNVAPYIAECLQSVLRQSRAVRAIVVIDGSTDSTLAEVQNVVRGHDGYVSVVVQENAGLSAARNAGLSLVKTEYVTFLDGDDRWCDDYLNVVLPLLSSEQVDVVEYDASLLDEGGGVIDLLKIAFAPAQTQTPVSLEGFLSCFRCYAWARVYRTSLVRAYPYPLGRRFEDTATTPWYYWNSKNNMSVGKPLVGYRQRPQSILKMPTSQDVNDIAATTTEAATMFAETRDEYWRRVAYRSFHQGCNITIKLPLRAWPSCLRVSRAAIQTVPPSKNLARWLQFHFPMLYLILLAVKRFLEVAYLQRAS